MNLIKAQKFIEKKDFGKALDILLVIEKDLGQSLLVGIRMVCIPKEYYLIVPKSSC